MKTAKGHSYNTLFAFNTLGDNVGVLLGHSKTLTDVTFESIEQMIPVISERIVSDQKPAVTLVKQLERIEHHRVQLLDAYEKLFECYKGMITPQTRQSPIDKARLAMLSGMPDKMLRQYAEMHLAGKADEFILPTEREQLINATVIAMKAAEAVKEGGK